MPFTPNPAGFTNQKKFRRKFLRGSLEGRRGCGEKTKMRAEGEEKRKKKRIDMEREEVTGAARCWIGDQIS